MTYLEATQKLIADPNCELDINTLSKEDRTELVLWVKTCNLIFNEGIPFGERWKREEEIIRSEYT